MSQSVTYLKSNSVYLCERTPCPLCYYYFQRAKKISKLPNSQNRLTCRQKSGLMSVIQLHDKIEVKPGIAGGQPRIAGTRITVKQIAVWHEFMGWSADEIATEYDLSLSDIYAALSYFFDHRQEIMDAIEAEEILVAEMKSRFPSKIAQKRG